MAKREPLAFMSYAHFADEHDKGYLTNFCKRLSGEVQMLTGEQFPIFLDRKDIRWGESWKGRIKKSLDNVTFLIPIITPGFFKSNNCCDELKLFMKREMKLGRDNLILPVYYVDVPQLLQAKDKLTQALAARQYADWREMRFEELDSKRARIEINKLASHICRALDCNSSLDAKTNQKDGNRKSMLIESNTQKVVDELNCKDLGTRSLTIAKAVQETRIVIRTGDRPFITSGVRRVTNTPTFRLGMK